MNNIAKYKAIQSTAQEVLYEIKDFIAKGVTEKDIAAECVKLLKGKGITETWYHGVPALVLCGIRSKVSVSGREYLPADEVVSDKELITIDLSPSKGNIWGDCARSFAVEDGVVTDQPEDKDFISGFNAEIKLHNELLEFAKPGTTFSELYRFANKLIIDIGFENLDFLNNLGHSIETEISKRIFIEIGNNTPLSSVNYFTFEPHIANPNSKWGFKHENIYFFDTDGNLCKI